MDFMVNTNGWFHGGFSLYFGRCELRNLLQYGCNMVMHVIFCTMRDGDGYASVVDCDIIMFLLMVRDVSTR